MTRTLRITLPILLAFASVAADAQPPRGPGGPNGRAAANPDALLRQIIIEQELTGDAARGRDLPEIDDSLAQLGMQLFFSKSLGGGFDSACVSCHHPSLGGADGLSLSVGVHAENPDLLGPGRFDDDGLPDVPRNAPTVFNVGLWDTGLFWDSRVESLVPTTGDNGEGAGIRTPDSRFGVADRNAGPNLVAAQARFPVTSTEEMKTESFESGSRNGRIRFHIGARLGDYSLGSDELLENAWLPAFQRGYNSGESARDLINYSSIAMALGEYQRSMVFSNNAWKAYVEGDEDALSEQQKAGAVLFFTTTQNGGAGCFQCHGGDLFSDGSHEIVGFPQIGPGKGDGNADDFGRERETGNRNDRYRFRVPSLLNVEVTAPYGHTGAYETLAQVMRHYDNPRRSVNDFFEDLGACQLDQFEAVNGCESLYPQAERNSNLALNELQRARNARDNRFGNINLNNQEVQQLVAFLQALTDPCVLERECLAPWVADPSSEGPDGLQLNGVDERGRAL